MEAAMRVLSGKKRVESIISNDVARIDACVVNQIESVDNKDFKMLRQSPHVVHNFAENNFSHFEIGIKGHRYG